MKTKPSKSESCEDSDLEGDESQEDEEVLEE